MREGGWEVETLFLDLKARSDGRRGHLRGFEGTEERDESSLNGFRVLSSGLFRPWRVGALCSSGCSRSILFYSFPVV